MVGDEPKCTMATVAAEVTTPVASSRTISRVPRISVDVMNCLPCQLDDNKQSDVHPIDRR